MSHYVRIRTQLRERNMLLRSLQDLGLPFEEGERLAVRGDPKKKEWADVIVTASPDADIGLRYNGEAYDIVADWYRIEQTGDLRREQFLKDLQRRYSYQLVLDQAKEQNLIVEEERLEDGDIVLVLSERG